MKDDKAAVLVVEDDGSLREGLMDVLVFHGYSVSGEEDGEEGLNRALKNDYDIIVLDVMLPTKDGFSICKELRSRKPEQSILMLTAKGSEDDIVKGFRAGADDYVTKPFSIRELMVRIEALLRRNGKLFGNRPLKILDMFFDGNTLEACCKNTKIKFTRREMDIVFYLQKNRERIISKSELLANVWCYPDPEIETRTVDIHMAKLRKKLSNLKEGAPDSSIIETVRGEGYRMIAK